jgi:hypothetical protein
VIGVLSTTACREDFSRDPKLRFPLPFADAMSSIEKQEELRTRLAATVREWLRRIAIGDEHESLQSDRMRRAARAICCEALVVGGLVEHVMLICKDEWRSLPEAQRMERAEADETIARVISLCIDEYYSLPDEVASERSRRSIDGLPLDSSASFPHARGA